MTDAHTADWPDDRLVLLGHARLIDEVTGDSGEQAQIAAEVASTPSKVQMLRRGLAAVFALHSPHPEATHLSACAACSTDDWWEKLPCATIRALEEVGIHRTALAGTPAEVTS